jgi:hypothetical protein
MSQLLYHHYFLENHFVAGAMLVQLVVAIESEFVVVDFGLRE